MHSSFNHFWSRPAYFWSFIVSSRWLRFTFYRFQFTLELFSLTFGHFQFTFYHLRFALEPFCFVLVGLLRLLENHFWIICWLPFVMTCGWYFNVWSFLSEINVQWLSGHFWYTDSVWEWKEVPVHKHVSCRINQWYVRMKLYITFSSIWYSRGYDGYFVMWLCAKTLSE